MSYLLEDNEYYCARHNERFAKTGSCSACANDLGPAPDQESDEPMPPPPAGCLSTVDLEARLLSDADALADLIVRLDPDRDAPKPKGKAPVAGFDYHVANTIGKLFAERTKLLRAAMVCARAREDEVIVKRREAREREMQRGATH